MAKRKKTEAPAFSSVWVGVWEGVTLIDPKTGKLKDRAGIARTFTVAASRGEALKVMRDGLLWCPDVEDPGEAAHVCTLPIPPEEVPAAVQFMLKCGARFCMPPRQPGPVIGDIVALLLK